MSIWDGSQVLQNLKMFLVSLACGQSVVLLAGIVAAGYLVVGVETSRVGAVFGVGSSPAAAAAACAHRLRGSHERGMLLEALGQLLLLVSLAGSRGTVGGCAPGMVAVGGSLRNTSGSCSSFVLIEAGRFLVHPTLSLAAFFSCSKVVGCV